MPHDTSPTRASSGRRPETIPHPRSTPVRVLVVALVFGIAMLSFYVHVLHEQVDRGSAARQALQLPSSAGGSGATRPSPVRVAERR